MKASTLICICILAWLAPSDSFRVATKHARNETIDPDPEEGMVVAAAQTVVVIPYRQQIVDHLNEKIDPQGLLAAGFLQLSPLMHKALRGEIITGTEVAAAAAAIGIAALGMINPLLGAFATFLWGFIGGGGGNQLAELESRILGQTQLLIRDSEFQTRLTAVKNAILSSIDRIQECCDPEAVAREDLKEHRNSLADNKRVVFGECVDNSTGDACNNWRTYNGGGTEALQYAIMYSEAQMHLDGMIAQLSTTSGGAEWAGRLLQNDGIEYAKYVADHYTTLFDYRQDNARYTKQTYTKGRCYSYSNVFGCTDQEWEVRNNGNDEYLRGGYASSSSGCLMQGHKARCKGDYAGWNLPKCSDMLPQWSSGFDQCLSGHKQAIASQMRTEMRPSVAAMCSEFGDGYNCTSLP